VFIENRLTRRALLSALSVLPAARLLRGQQSQDPQLPTLKRAPQPKEEGEETPKYTGEVQVVNVYATVKEKGSSKLIKDLTQDNFTLEEEGKPQTIKFFEAESSLPLNLGLLVDTGYSQAGVLGDERSAGIKFFDQILRDKDQAFVIHFDHDIELLQDFTGSRDKLDKALNLLEPAQPQQQQQTQQQGGNYPQGGGPGGYPGGGGRRYPQTNRSRGVTKLYDAILLASEDLMGKQKGRKAVVLLADGIDSGSKTTLFEAISAAQKADTLVYSVYFADNEAYGNPGYGGMGRRGGGRMPPPSGSQGPDGKKILQQLAEETGGTFNSVGTFHHLDKIFADIQEELRSQYNIGYTPDPRSEAGLYRHIHLTAKQKKKELVVQARAGYYAR
jgi:VWFA-related protein